MQRQRSRAAIVPSAWRAMGARGGRQRAMDRGAAAGRVAASRAETAGIPCAIARGRIARCSPRCRYSREVFLSQRRSILTRCWPYEMNGPPLPLLHGAPLRVITPGWMAESCMKWLTEITVRADESPGYYMQQAYRIPETAIHPTSGLPGTGSVMAPVERMLVKSLIAAPAEGDTVKPGPVTIRGVAWAGEETVAKVEVSCDRWTHVGAGSAGGRGATVCLAAMAIRVECPHPWTHRHPLPRHGCAR